MILSADEKKTLTKMQYPIMVKFLENLRLWGYISQHNEGNMQKYHRQHHAKQRKIELFPLSLGAKQGFTVFLQ